MSKKSLILMIVTLLCIITTVVLRGVVDKADAEYTEVEVRVVSSDTVYRKILGKRQMQYDVFVSYLGQEYELKNAHSSAPYIPGRSVTAYLSKGNLYANIEGVKTSTPAAMVYFGFLFASFAMLVTTLSSFGSGRKKLTAV
ncbi:penicillin-binding protein [Hungatella hathewayi]|uniref:penicillin-binding protein n=1 Tax=Hungatella hathewayi TaxID=154046 RepID=UPI00321A3A9E